MSALAVRVARELLLWPARLLGGFALLMLLVVGPALPPRWFYRDGRPTDLGRRGNALVAWIYGIGIVPGMLVRLDARGRRSGRRTSTALVVGRHEGARYLVSMLGESVDWVRNVRAARGEATIRHGWVERVRLEEVPPGARAPILKAYLRRAIGARPHVEVDHRAPLAEFEKVADRYPVFRVVTRPAVTARSPIRDCASR